MTLGAMWVRHYGKTGVELVGISDSHLSGGKSWTSCPKVFPAVRGDCVFSFAGETDYAYPLIMHASSAIDSWEESANRRYSLEKLSGQLARVMSLVLDDTDFSRLSGPPPEDRTLILMGGYSWQHSRWRIYEFAWSPADGRVSHKQIRVQDGDQRGLIAWVGDVDAVNHAKRRLNQELSLSGRSRHADGLNMEPLKILRDIIRESQFPSVGGPLQLVKVYRHLDSRLFRVRWRDHPSAEGFSSLQGRKLLTEETSLRFAEIDVDRPDVFENE